MSQPLDSEARLQISRQLIDKLNPQVVTDLSPLAKTVALLHKKTDALGKRFTPAEIQTLARQRDALAKLITDKYNGNPFSDLSAEDMRSAIEYQVEIFDELANTE